MAGRNRLACFGARDKGTCDNHLTIRRDEVEARVLKALEEKLLNQELFEEFCEEFTREMNRLRGEHRANLVAGERELARLEARRKKLVESIMEGVPGSEVKAELIAIVARREELQRQHAAITEPKPLLHPEMTAIYRAKVTALARALQEPESRSEATEGVTRPRGRHRSHARPGRGDASDRVEGESGSHAGGHRTNEEVAGIRRPLPASIFGCGGGI